MRPRKPLKGRQVRLAAKALLEAEQFIERERGPKPQVSDRRLLAALITAEGNFSRAGRLVGLDRSTVWERFHTNDVLRIFTMEYLQDVGDMVESNIIELCRDKDGAMLRFYADRKMKDRGYGLRVQTEDVTPPDPEAEKRRLNAIKILAEVINERIAKGLPPLFAKPKQIEGKTVERGKP